MSEHTFTLWLRGELTSARCALLTLYEQRDKLQYIDGPRLEKAYMDAVGTYEEAVIKEEIEVELLEKKERMIQIALNRHEPIDEAAIDAALDIERQIMLQEAAGPAAPAEYAELSAEQNDELQELYRDIVRAFHPQMHPELTDIQRELFKKAQEAYRRADLEALRLIHEMLYSADDGSILPEWSRELLLKLMDGLTIQIKEEEISESENTTDYTLASQLYDHFKPTSEEAVIREKWVHCRQSANSIMNEMDRLRSEFPYNASQMLSDPEKIQAYKDELAFRLRTATSEREQKQQKIREMLKGVAVNA